MSHSKTRRAARPKLTAALCLAFAAFAASASGQNGTYASAQPAAASIFSGRAVLDANPQPARAKLIREIDDSSLGWRWLLYRDPVHPGGPGRLVPVGSITPDRARTSPSVAYTAMAPRSFIHAGDRVVLEEDTPVVDARLQAVALGPALVGSPLQVRLAIGGKVLPAIAIAPGRAALAPQLEIRQ